MLNPAAHAEAVQEAYQAYLDRLEALALIRQCLSHWPDDPPAPGYLGTRCDRLDDGHGPGKHRHKVPGSSVVVTW